MPKVFLGIGSNLGDRAGYLEFARKELLSVTGLTDLRCSSVYETEPVSAEGGPFLNAVWSFETDLLPRELLNKLQEIESKADRQRNKPNAARTLDLDLLAYGNEAILEDGLQVPHPRMHERRFVLEPFCDFAPEWVHPVLGKTIRELLYSTMPQSIILSCPNACFWQVGHPDRRDNALDPRPACRQAGKRFRG